MANFYNYIQSIFDEIEKHFFNPTTETKSSDFHIVGNQSIAKVEGDELHLAVSVVGHDPKKVTVDLTEDKIFVKAVKDSESKTLESAFVRDIDDSFKLGRDYNGLSAKATIEKGILKIVVQKKEDSKPKKLSITF